MDDKTKAKVIKYAAIIAVAGAALVAGGYLLPATWVTMVTGLIGII